MSRFPRLRALAAGLALAGSLEASLTSTAQADPPRRGLFGFGQSQTQAQVPTQSRAGGHSHGQRCAVCEAKARAAQAQQVQPTQIPDQIQTQTPDQFPTTTGMINEASTPEWNQTFVQQPSMDPTPAPGFQVPPPRLEPTPVQTANNNNNSRFKLWPFGGRNQKRSNDVVVRPVVDNDYGAGMPPTSTWQGMSSSSSSSSPQPTAPESFQQPYVAPNSTTPIENYPSANASVGLMPPATNFPPSHAPQPTTTPPPNDPAQSGQPTYGFGPAGAPPTGYGEPMPIGEMKPVNLIGPSSATMAGRAVQPQFQPQSQPTQPQQPNMMGMGMGAPMVEMGSAEMGMGASMMGMPGANVPPTPSPAPNGGWGWNQQPPSYQPGMNPGQVQAQPPMNIPRQGWPGGPPMYANQPRPGWGGGYPPSGAPPWAGQARVRMGTPPSTGAKIFKKMLGIPTFTTARSREHQAELEYRRAQVIREAAIRDMNTIPASMVYGPGR